MSNNPQHTPPLLSAVINRGNSNQCEQGGSTPDWTQVLVISSWSIINFQIHVLKKHTAPRKLQWDVFRGVCLCVWFVFFSLTACFWDLQRDEHQHAETQAFPMQGHLVLIVLVENELFPVTVPGVQLGLLASKADEAPGLCTDFRKVNAVTKLHCFPLPHMDDCIHNKCPTRVKIDLLKRYFQDKTASYRWIKQ